MEKFLLRKKRSEPDEPSHSSEAKEAASDSKVEKRAWGSVPALADKERVISFVKWSEDPDFCFNCLKTHIYPRGNLFSVDGERGNGSSYVMTCRVCKLVLEPKRKRDVKSHVEKCRYRIEAVKAAGSLFEREHMNQSSMKTLVVHAYTGAVLESGHSASSCEPFRKLISNIFPGFADLVPEGERLMRHHVPELFLKVNELSLDPVRGVHLSMALDSTGDKSSLDKKTNKLRTATVAIPDGRHTASLCVALDALSSSENTAISNNSWFTGVVVDTICSGNVARAIVVLDGVSSDWGSDNTGKEMREAFLKVFTETYWFRCFPHMFDVTGKLMKVALVVVMELVACTNAWHHVNSRQLAEGWVELKTMEARNFSLVSSFGVDLNLTLPPAVNVTRWTPFWTWLDWVIPHFLVLKYYVEHKVSRMTGEYARRLVDVMSNDPAKLYAQLVLLHDSGEEIANALTIMQGRQPMIHRAARIIENVHDSLVVADKRKIQERVMTVLEELKKVIRPQLSYAIQVNIHFPDQNGVKEIVNEYTEYVAVPAFAKFNRCWEDYPAQEKKLILMAASLDYKSKKEDRCSFEKFKSAVIFTKELVNGEIQSINWNAVESEWIYWQNNYSADWKSDEKDEDLGDDVLLYWKSARVTLIFPHLHRIALRILQLVINSCDPERVFSVFRRVIVDQTERHSMSPEKKVGMVRLKYNSEAGPSWVKGYPSDRLPALFGNWQKV
jgi:hypothetical protein